jgi:hypothetical protein
MVLTITVAALTFRLYRWGGWGGARDILQFDTKDVTVQL